MSREDFEVFDLIKAERKLKRQQRRDEFKGGPGWTRHHNTQPPQAPLLREMSHTWDIDALVRGEDGFLAPKESE